MKAIVKYAKEPKKMEIREVPEPKPGKKQVKVAVDTAGICGSDLHIYYEHIDVPMQYPVIIGHEYSGTITELGEGVNNLKVGDHVISETTFSSCGECRYCRYGEDNLCPDRRIIGYSENGAFADYIVVPARRVHKLPNSIDLEKAPIIEPLAVGYHSVIETANIKLNDLVLIAGPGPIGLISGLIAKCAGARVVIFGKKVDTNRLALAKEIGLDCAINSDEKDQMDYLHDVIQSENIDVFLECSGSETAVNLGLKLLRRKGKYIQIALFQKPINIDMKHIIFKEIKLLGAFGHNWLTWEKAINIFDTQDNKYKFSSIVSEVLPLINWQDAFEKLKTRESIKILLKPEFSHIKINMKEGSK